MLKINVRLDVERLSRGFAAQAKQIRYATAVALTRTAKFAEAKIKEEIGRVFDRPTSWTRNSTYVTTARKDRLWAEVKIKDEAFKSVAAIKWLSPEIYGGPRVAKRFEELLRSRGILGAGMYAVPAAGARLDRYGNMSRGQVVQILSQVGASRDALQNQTGRSRRRAKGRAQYFALAHPRGRLRPGIYQRVGETVRPVMVFVRQPRYGKRLRFFEIADAASQYKFPLEFRLAMRQALASAR